MGRHRLSTDECKERFWARVEVAGPDECWTWKGPLSHGYGTATWNGRPTRAHRIAYMILVGDIPAGMLMLHGCDNPACVNPSHLRPGTPADNMADRDSRGRQYRGDRHWTKLHPERMARGPDHWTRKQPELLARGPKSGAHTHPERIRRGANHSKSKFVEQDIIDIRNAHAAGEKCSTIARRYPFASRTVVSNIIHNKTWKHVRAKGDSNAIVDALPV